MPKPFKLAMIQMQVRGGEKAANVTHASELVEEAASQGAEVILLPECLDLGWTHPSALEEAEPIPGGGPCNALQNAARKNKVYLCAGLTEKAGPRVFNSAVILSPSGEILVKHRKLNELDIGHAYYSQGDRLNVVDTELGRFGLMICADGFARGEVLARSLCYMGADVILSPCAWARPAEHNNEEDPYGGVWRGCYVPVAKEFSTAIFGASCVGWISGGPWEGRKCVGCSLAIGPDGKEILQGPYGPEAECILYVDVKPVARPGRGTDWGGYPGSQKRLIPNQD